MFALAMFIHSCLRQTIRLEAETRLHKMNRNTKVVVITSFYSKISLNSENYNGENAFSSP
jgi:hypothetical protein